MIQLKTMLVPADNSGAKRLMVIGISTKIGKIATLGDVIPCVVKGADSAGIVTDHEKVRVLIVRTRKEVGRTDGSYVRFDDNAVVLLEKGKLDPKAGRVFGPIPRELAEKGFQKIISLAQEVI